MAHMSFLISECELCSAEFQSTRQSHVTLRTHENYEHLIDLVFLHLAITLVTCDMTSNLPKS